MQPRVIDESIDKLVVNGKKLSNKRTLRANERVLNRSCFYRSVLLTDRQSVGNLADLRWICDAENVRIVSNSFTGANSVLPTILNILATL